MFGLNSIYLEIAISLYFNIICKGFSNMLETYIKRSKEYLVVTNINNNYMVADSFCYLTNVDVILLLTQCNTHKIRSTFVPRA